MAWVPMSIVLVDICHKLLHFMIVTRTFLNAQIKFEMFLKDNYQQSLKNCKI